MAKKPIFRHAEISDYDKWINCWGPFGFKVDYDDVDDCEVEAGLWQMMEILNEHWNQERFEKEAEELRNKRYPKEAPNV